MKQGEQNILLFLFIFLRVPLMCRATAASWWTTFPLATFRHAPTLLCLNNGNWLG